MIEGYQLSLFEVTSIECIENIDKNIRTLITTIAEKFQLIQINTYISIQKL